MTEYISHWLNRKFPQNFIIRHPVAGSLMAGLFCLIFIVLYRPLEIDQGHFRYDLAATFYSLIATCSIMAAIYGLKRTNRFNDSEQWSIKKESAAIAFIFAIAGTVIYFAGFIVEVSNDRWYILMYLDSVMKTFLIGGIPFLFFTSLNVYSLFNINYPAAVKNKDQNKKPSGYIELETPLKNDTLHFRPDEFIYAFSDGNYVIFHLIRNDKFLKKTIRCTLNSVENQLSAYPVFFRTHRKHIINLKMIKHVNRSSAGYFVQLQGVKENIPVARGRSREFKKARQQAGLLIT